METYTYRVPVHRPSSDPVAGDDAEDLADVRLSTSRRRPLAGVLVLEASQIRNVLIVTIPDDVVSEILELPDEAAPSPDGGAPDPAGERAHV